LAKKVILVDDSKTILATAQMALEDLESSGAVTLVTYQNPAELLDLLINGSEDFDLLISDINMPQMDGFELLKAIKKDFAQIKVLIISAYDSDGYRTKSLELGALHFFEKPLNFTRLKETIDKELKS